MGMESVSFAVSNPAKRFLTDVESAARLGISVSTLRRWRLLGTGPVWLKIGASVRYDVSALEAYLADCPHGGGQAAR
jgi:predicted DNA-binding transcriptional regulator AlpA